MVDIFCTKYFHKEETVTLATLQATKQRGGKGVQGSPGGNVYDKHNQGVQGSPGKLRHLPICTIVAKG